jgi:hypothetical protein
VSHESPTRQDHQSRGLVALSLQMSAPNYCNPPFHPDPGYDETRGRGPFWMSVHLDTRPPGPGIYTSWCADCFALFFSRSLNHLTGKAVGRLGSGSGVVVPRATLPVRIVYKRGMLAVLPENTTTHQPHLLLLPRTQAVDPATCWRLLCLLLHTQSLHCQSRLLALICLLLHCALPHPLPCMLLRILRHAIPRVLRCVLLLTPPTYSTICPHFLCGPRWLYCPP